MRIVQSFWFAPARPSTPAALMGHSGFAGFAEERHFWYAWALSLGLLKKHFGDAHLVTDVWGSERAKTLGLAHSSVSTELENISKVRPELWALPKLLVYAAQREPFWHVDTDAFLFEKPSELMLSSPVVCQGPETHPEQVAFYLRILARMRSELAWLPEGYADYNPAETPPLNCGIVGGTDVALLRSYAEDSLSIFFRPENQPGWARLAADKAIPLAHFNCAVEQVNLAIHCRQRGVSPVPILSAEHKGPRLVHLVGGDKTHPESIARLGALLLKRLPKAKQNIDGVFRAEKALKDAAPSAHTVNRALHSFWFPEFSEIPSSSFGFPDRKYFWYSWVLSFIGLKSSFDEVILYSTPYGTRIASDILGLGYHQIKEFPQGMREVPKGAWNAGKFLVYLQQDRPFVHVDTDAVLWTPLPKHLRQCPVVAESFEWSESQREYYTRGLRLCREKLTFFPDALSRYDSNFTRGFAVNCGVLGGTHLSLLHDYARSCLEVLLHPGNAAGFAALARVPADLGAAVVTLEQLLILDFCDRYRVMPELLIEPCPLPDENEEIKYSHLYGDAKKGPAYLELIARRIESLRPDLKRKIDDAYLSGVI